MRRNNSRPLRFPAGTVPFKFPKTFTKDPPHDTTVCTKQTRRFQRMGEPAARGGGGLVAGRCRSSSPRREVTAVPAGGLRGGGGATGVAATGAPS